MSDNLSSRQLEALLLAWRDGFISTSQVAWQTIHSLLKSDFIYPVSSDNPSPFSGNSYQLTAAGHQELLDRKIIILQELSEYATYSHRSD